MTINWSKETVLITGASSGLGQALAVETAKLGATSILIARDRDRLDSVVREVAAAGGKAFAFVYDLHDVDGIPVFYETIKKETGLVPTILVNNAGYNVSGFVANTPISLYRKNFDVNLFAPIALIQSVLPDMVENGWGCMVNVIGAANYHSFPANGAYSGTKVALQAMHESLQAELDALPVHTLIFNPGSMKTDYNKNRDVGNRLGDYTYKEHSGCVNPVPSAKAMFKAIEKRQKVLDCATGLDRLGKHLTYFVPGLVDKLILDRNQSLLKNHPFV